MRQLRLIYDVPMDGAHNMAVDEAILSAVVAGASPPTLRFYAWMPPCLSLGYGQPASDIDVGRLNALGWRRVRRPTGGRAILHTDEVTYSVALPADHALAEGDVVASYRRISRALVAGLELLGAAPKADKSTDSGNGGPVCFETPSHYEITIGGRKLVGSAQVRRRGGVLQHGTLPLCGDVARICDALVYPDDASRERAKTRVRARATTLTEALNGQVVSWEQAAQAVAQGFVKVFDFVLEAGVLSAAERAHSVRLAVEVYGNDAWTLRR